MTNAPPPPGPLAVSGPWDLVSAGYAAESLHVMLPFSQDAIELVRPERSAHVIDVAAGPGTLALELAPRVARIDAVDFAPAMLEKLEEARRARGLDNVFSAWADGQALPFPDASFDAGFSMFGLMFFPDRKQGFRELHRVLKPGAKAVVSSWAPVADSPFMVLMFGALCAADPSRAPPQTNLLSLENPELFAQEMTEAGFRNVEVRRFTHAFQVSDAETYWRGATLGSAPIAVLKQRLGPDEWLRQSELALAYLREQIPSPREFATTAFLGSGTR